MDAVSILGGHSIPVGGAVPLSAHSVPGMLSKWVSTGRLISRARMWLGKI